MKKLVLILLLFTEMIFAQNISFSNDDLKNYLISTNCVDTNNDGAMDSNADTNNDNEISFDEAESIFSLKVNDLNITTFNELHHFNNLKSLDLKNNNIESIDLSNISELRSLNISNNLLQNINVSNNLELTSLTIENNMLNELNLEENTSLLYLNCSLNNIESLNLESNTELSLLNANHNQLNDLDLSSNNFLHSLSIINNPMEILFINNGNPLTIFNFQLTPLEYICTNEPEIAYYEEYISNQLPNCIVNDFCTVEKIRDIYSLEGNIFLDADDNGCEEDEKLNSIINFKITNNNGIDFMYCSNEENYTIPFPTDGQYTVTPILENDDLFDIYPSEVEVSFSEEQSIYFLEENFCIQPKASNKNIDITIIPKSEARPGFQASYLLIYENTGNTILNGNIQLSFEANFSDYISSIPADATINSDNIVWDFSNLLPFEKREIIVDFELNTPLDDFPLNGGDTLIFSAKAFDNMNPSTELNESYLAQMIVNSYDPNDITCLEGDSIKEEQIGDYLTYKIRFENTGSASAVNIHIDNEIDEEVFDLNTIKLINSSHECKMTLEGNKLTFYFDNIMLPFEDATNDGYVVYKIKTLENLNIDVEFKNKADIFFDYNAPIITNTAKTTIQKLNIEKNNLKSFSIHPNPAKNSVQISTKNYSIKKIEICDIHGKTVFVQNYANYTTNEFLNLEHLTTGIYLVKTSSDNEQLIEKLIIQ
ncbi:T9SS type A sorting domain-containing protein [Aureivirga sp. CE67]|uniref:DUF7619 domain-containing protein n=1 Tax=Aureivirga sp. CE67 TaxID=1788983 RepID=UPI0018CBDB19|nr:T9SS type A sorting domain-containing protein [Aureivirga sp. CE67]